MNELAAYKTWLAEADCQLCRDGTNIVFKRFRSLSTHDSASKALAQYCPDCGRHILEIVEAKEAMQ